MIDLLVNELKRRFQQKRGVPIAAMIENVLISAANRTSVELEELTTDLQMYERDIDLQKLKIQLQMLPDLIRTRNMNIPK